MRVMAVLAVSIALILSTFLGIAHAEGQMYVHFVVITSSDDVTETDFQDLKNVFLQHAGGYTELPSTVGCSMHDGVVQPEETNTTFYVAGKTDISAQIKEFTKGNNHFSDPFILVWQAERK